MSEPAVDDLISVAEAIAILDAVALTPRTSRLPLAEAAGRQLAEEIRADADAPPFEKALMDGYAVRAADAAESGTTLTIVDTIAAGAVGQITLQAGQAAAMMTGAPLPRGADAVIPVEQTAVQQDRVTLGRAVRVGDAVAHRGSDTRAGALLLPVGTRLTPAAVAVAASVGAAMPLVWAKPKVTVLSTGDELVAINETPSGAQIRNSNSIMLQVLLERLGCDVTNLGIARDDPAELRAVMETGLESDALFITGGMSMGQRDFVPGLMRELGLTLRISKLRIKPGKPFAFATGQPREGASPMIFGLPGNPVSAFVCTVRLANRILSRLSGGSPDAGVTHAVLDGDLPANGPREFYQPSLWTDGVVRPLPWKGSADIFTLARADALIIRPENAPAATAGQTVPVLPLP